MDPYLEAPDIWPDVHNSLMKIYREQLAPAPPLADEDAAWMQAILTTT